MVMEEGTSDDDGTCTSSDDELERIVLHVYDDESKEFSSLTTYHGMSGSVLFGYHSHPTFFKTTDSLLMEEHLPAVTICRLGGADQWRQYHEIRSRIEFVSAFGAVLLGESLDARRIMDLHRLEDVFLNITRTRFNIRRFLEESRTWILHNILTVEHVDPILDAHRREAIIFQVHRKNGAIAIKSSGWLVPRGKTAKLSIQPRKKVLLELGNWGDCTEGDRPMETFYERAACERDCVVAQIMNRCGCAPFFAEVPFTRACGLVEMYRCSRQVECEILDFSKAVITYLKKKQKEHTTIEISLRSRRLQTDEQLKRIKAVDLLSYVAGSMGLFLGMSCVTLLEIFIYLFKSVWGVFSDQRHKSYYLDNFLGDDGLENDDVPDEEIVITTKTRSSEIAVETENNGMLIEHMDSSSTTIASTSRQSVAFVPASQEHSSPIHYDHHRSRMKIQIVHHPFQRRKSSFAI
ncbi:hypothetical protein GCK32_000977 [Trichostrongylus colubriformis]|uniref:Uncharacterized protein n=1 Tax=Trichostrongylus colubriformis TaxID=6319 RepID=A0AAN8IJ70_TRICO